MITAKVLRALVKMFLVIVQTIQNMQYCHKYKKSYFPSHIFIAHKIVPGIIKSAIDWDMFLDF